ncbi:hypothetical protein M885DRAFT_471385, partial [Pelagophyceae sp. CCMP2097]
MAVGPTLRRHRDARAYGYLGKALRWFAVQLHLDHGWSARRIAVHLRGGNLRLISESTVHRIVRIYDETGDVYTPSGGRRISPATTITANDWLILRPVLDYSPDMYLDEMQELLWAETGREYPISTICTTLRRYNYTRRKLRAIMIRRDFVEEANFIEVF